jgi:hypothetical protein
LWQVAKEYDSEMAHLHRYISAVEDRVGEHTVVHADLHWRGRFHQIIVVGKYRDRDYVRVFNLEASDWTSLVEKLHAEEKGAKVGRFDMPHAMPLSVVYKRERF